MNSSAALCYTFFMMGRWWMILAWMVLVSSGCAVTDSEFEVGPPRLTYLQLHDSPETYRGQPVTLGGKVLSAKRLKEGTRIEILQLPLGSSLKPTRDLRQSQGRFIALKKEFLDPATIPPGTFITVSGDAAGSITLPLDETEYLFPIVEIKTLRVWPADEEMRSHLRPYPYMVPGPYWGPYWHPYWRPWPYW
jgi:outer membrane lipoprotein